MKHVLILCLAIITLLAFDSSAEAGRRKERRAAKKGGGVYAGVYQRRSGGGAYPVAKATYAESHQAQTTVAVAAADLTITEIAAEGDALCFTVRNVGQVASPETRLEVVISKPQAADIEAQNVRVLPLLPNQAVRIHVTSLPTANVQVDALVDPDRSIAELSEENNTLRVKLVGAIMASEPPTLTDGATWSHAGG